MTSNDEIYLSYLCDQILVACNRIHKKLDKYDESLSSYTTPVISYHEQPSWQVATDVVQPRPPPDPPNGQPWNYVHPGYQHYSHHRPLTAAYGQPPYPSFDSGVNNTCWPPPLTAPAPEMQLEPSHIYPLPPHAQMPEPYHHYPSLTPELDNPYYHYRPSEELYPPVYYGEGYSVNSYNYSVDDYSPYIDSWQPEDHRPRSPSPPDRMLHPPSWLPSNCSPAAAAVRHPPHLREPFSLPQHQVSNSTPTYIASAVSRTTTTQSRSCHGQPVAVLQPLLSPTSLCCSTIVPLATDAAIPPAPQQRSPSGWCSLSVMDKKNRWEVVPSNVVVPNNGDVASFSHQSVALDTDAHKGNTDDLTPKLHDSNKNLGIEGNGSCDAKMLIQMKKDRSFELKNTKDNDDFLEKNSIDDVEEILVDHYVAKLDRYAFKEISEVSHGKVMIISSESTSTVENFLSTMGNELFSFKSHVGPSSESKILITLLEGIHFIASLEDISLSIQAGRRGIYEVRHLAIQCVFDPGGDSSSKHLFATLFAVSWFPP